MQKLKNCKKLLIEINQTCNLNCSYCFYRDYGRITKSISMENIDELLKKCPYVKEFYLTGGECFTSPIIEQIITKLSLQGEVTVFTNGVILNKYDDDRLKNIIDKVNTFIITFDSFDFKSYLCRDKLSETYEIIKRIVNINPDKLEVKICINKYNYDDIENIFLRLIDMGVIYLSVNFIFDINNSSISHEIKDLKKLKNVFEIIYKYKDYFNIKYIDMLYDLYINNRINDSLPCLADKEYFFLDSSNNYLICPGNLKGINSRGDWKLCFSKECANEWEMMYKR